MAGENAARRAMLFDQFTKQRGHEDVTRGEIFFCPLCRTPFGREALDPANLRLTLAHIIPDALGGTWTTLACDECNNDKGGHELEADLAASMRVSDWVQGTGSLEVRMGDGSVLATATRFPDENRWHFEITTPMASPSVQELHRRGEAIVQNPAAAQTMNFTLPLYRPGRCWAAVCQSAYLLMFHYYGYDFARSPTYGPLRQQILRPDEQIVTGNIFIMGEDVAANVLQGKQAAVMFILKPVRAVLAVMRFRSPGKVNLVLAVVMPGPGEPPLEPTAITNFSGTVVPHEPELMAEQQGLLWLRWHQWRAIHERGEEAKQG
jgi:HNH endonuclease